jgi:SSS family solute:Na+ symporter
LLGIDTVNILGFRVDVFWVIALGLAATTGLYTVLGGLRVIMYTAVLQAPVLILGSVCILFAGLSVLGSGDLAAGWRATVAAASTNLHLIRPLEDPEWSWAAVLPGSAIIGFWYWCTDQYIVQRVLGAPNERVGRRGSIFAAFLKLFPVYLFIVPGLICFALAKSGKIPELASMVSADGKPVAAATQAAFPLMVKYLLPEGLRGIVVAGLLSALMGSLAGVFNACSTLFTVDLYQKWRPKASQKELVHTGRLATSACVVLGLAWIPVIRGAHGLYGYLQAVQSYLAPPIFVVFFLGVFWRRANARGCFWALVVGFALGALRMLIDTPVSLEMQSVAGGYRHGSFLWVMNNINFQYFSVLITAVSALVLVGVSLASAAPDAAQIQGLTFATLSDSDREKSRTSWSWREVAASAFILACILAAYIYFTG